MYIFRKIVLAIAALSFAFVISSCKDPLVISRRKTPSPKYVAHEESYVETEKLRPEKHHRRW